MTTTELIRKMAERLSITQIEAKRLMELQLQAITQHLKAGRSVVLRNFGTFGVRVTPRHKGVLPQDGAVMIPDRRHVSFHAGKALKEEVREANHD